MSIVLSKKELIKLLKRKDTKVIAVASRLFEDDYGNTMEKFGLNFNSNATIQVKVTLEMPKDSEDEE